jgi:hypothetical protein
MTKLVLAIIDDDPRVALEFASEILDKESGQLLRYQKLMTHPKYCEIWMHSLHTNLGGLRKELETKSNAQTKYSFSSSIKFSKIDSRI